ncbi:MAG: DUF6783 domain-containing protein [Ruminococcus sp.]
MRAKYTAKWGVQIAGMIFKHALEPVIAAKAESGSNFIYC